MSFTRKQAYQALGRVIANLTSYEFFDSTYRGTVSPGPWATTSLILPKGAKSFRNQDVQSRGLLIFHLYCYRDKEPLQSLDFLAYIESQLEGKSLEGFTFYHGSITALPETSSLSVNNAVIRYDYSLPFDYFGETL